MPSWEKRIIITEDLVGLAKDTTISEIITTLKNLKAVKYYRSDSGSREIAGGLTVSLVDTSALSTLIEVLAIFLVCDYIGFTFRIYMYNKDGTTTKVEEVLPSQVNSWNGESTLLYQIKYDTTNNEYIFALNRNIKLAGYGIKIEALNPDTPSHHARAIVVYRSLE